MESRDELLGLERQFWEAFRTNDAAGAAGLTDQECIVVGAQGVGKLSPPQLAGMMEHATYVLERYELDAGTLQMTSLGDNTEIVAYRVKEWLTVDGEPVTLEAFDSSVWVRRDAGWRCVLHTESIAGDPYGRDRHAP